MKALGRMLLAYNNIMVRHPTNYYGNCGFFNFGYWHGLGKSQGEASEALVDRLIGMITNKDGQVLDVACGVGATTRRLMGSYSPDMISAINISDIQLAEAQKRAPGCTFIKMNAVQLAFPDNHFNAIICVEAAFHFNTREAFLREALRVLRPSGSLVLSDILFRTRAAPFVDLYHVPRVNLLADISLYRKQMEGVGFDEVRVEDATEPCLRGFCRNLSAWPASEYRAGRSKLSKAIRRSIIYRMLAGYIGTVCKSYVLAAGRKPSEQQASVPSAASVPCRFAVHVLLS